MALTTREGGTALIENLIATYTYRGLWWIPSAPDEKLSGTLTIAKGDPRLDVVGDFGRDVVSESHGERAFSLSPADQQRVVGMTTDGRAVTLIDCTPVSEITSLPGLATAIYRARAAILGRLFGPDESIDFNEIEIRTTELERWVGHVPFPIEEVDAQNDAALAKIRMTRPRTIEIPLASGERTYLRFEIHTSGLGNVTTDASLHYAAWIGLRFTERRDLAGTTQAVDQLRNFLSLAVGRPLTLLEVDGYREAVDQHESRKPLRILYPAAHNPEPSARAVQPHQMLFTFVEARDRFAEVLGAWLDHHELLQPVFALYFGTLYNGSLYLEQQFIAFAQAIETYDRRRRPKEKERDKTKHKEVVREILEAAPEQHRKWLQEKLAYSNELSLAKRLEHVLDACTNVTGRIVGKQGVSDFIRSARDTRNYYTHWDPAMKHKAVTEPRDLYRLTLQMRTVLETVLLLELDFECRRIEGVLERAGRFNELHVPL